MGTLFRYVADGALKRAEAAFKRTCQVCSRRGIDIYPASGQVTQPDGTLGDDVEVACAECLHGNRVELSCAFEVDEVIRRYLSKEYEERSDLFRIRKLAELAAAYRRTPTIPLFVQRQDWPLCCCDLTEFTGSPKNKRELVRLSKQALYWEGQVKRNRIDFEDTGPPEYYGEVSIFQCLACQKVYWVWQFT